MNPPPSPLTFRVDLRRGDSGKIDRFSTKTFRADSSMTTKPDPKDHVSFDVLEIALDNSSIPWLDLTPPQRIDILWSNVLSVQYEEAQIA